MAKILYVEDELKISRIVSQRLKDEHYIVESAYDGKEGLEKYEMSQFDIIVLDLMLPKITGVELLKLIRDKDKKIPIIALTAKDGVDDKINGLDKGFDDYLTKPFAYQELSARIRALLRRSTTGEIVLSVGNLKLDPAKQVVTRKGKTIHLTSKEYAILEYLLRHKNQYISEGELIDKIWDSNYEGMSNTVAVHVKNLKNKVDKKFVFEKQLISSERNKGYILNG